MEAKLDEALTIRLHPALLDKIRRTAIIEHRSMSNTTRRLIEAGLAAKQRDGAREPEVEHEQR